jgi:[protein-PII] uridylyltransferase
MEPNIKDGFGGIRDANTLFWINKVIFNYPNNSYLVPKFANEEEFKEYRNSLEFLFKVRVFLHLVAKKKIDKVLIEYQREIALKLGFTDSVRLKAERKFIKELLKALWTINRFTHITIKKLIKPFLYKYSFKEITKKRISKNFYICENKIYTTLNNNLSFSKNFNLLINSQFGDYDISLVNYFQNIKKISKLHKKNLFYKENLYPLLKAFYHANTIEKLIYPFEKVKYLAQFDGYHQYPVDIHSLLTLKEIEDLKEFKELNTTDKVILRFSAIFHDLGKGRIGDHSIISAKIAKEFAQEINFPESDIIYKLVKHHTLMSNISQREDIHNDKTILSFAEIVENKRFLKLLLLLTIADMKAVGNNVFNSFKESLLKTLYYNTLEALENKDLINEISLRKRKEKLLISKEEFKQFKKSFQKQVLSSPSNQLFLQNSVNEILEILKWIENVKEYKYRFENEKYFKIHIAKKNHLNFSLGWFIDKIPLELTHLSIYKIGDIKYFKIEFLEKINPYDLPIIEGYIKKAFEEKLKTKHKVKFKESELEINCNHSQNYASLKIKTEDKKGIVSTIITILDNLELSVEDDKITSQKNIARDLFIISKENNLCNKIEKIKKGLIE